jgi:LacI family transcriptional regulator
MLRQLTASMAYTTKPTENACNMTRRAHARIDDVARLAGVSIATVSRAMTKPSQVREETLATVREAVRKLGYVAHGHARALASRKSRTIGAIVPTIQNSIFAETIFALQKTVRAEGYVLVVACNEYDLGGEIGLVQELIECGVDGLVLTQSLHRAEAISLLERFRVPYVLTWAYDSEGHLPAVGFDHWRASSLVTRHLLELGHRDFAIIATTTEGNRNAQDRLRGVIETLQGSEIELPGSRIVQSSFSFAEGRKAFRQIIDLGHRPTAIICLNDTLAIGAMAQAMDMGFKVPRDISVAGCEDLEVAASVVPTLTTVRYPSWEMGEVAGRYLLALIGGRSPPETRMFQTELVVRASTAAPSKRMRTKRKFV